MFICLKKGETISSLLKFPIVGPNNVACCCERLHGPLHSHGLIISMIEGFFYQRVIEVENSLDA